MDRSKSDDSITSRVSRLNQMLLSPYSKSGSAINPTLTTDALQDALLALYDECNKESLRKEPTIAEFVDKFSVAVEEIKTMRAKPRDFSVVSLIGRGNFGKIELVREKVTRNVYALKTMSKICSNGQREASSYEEERDILALAARPGASDWIPFLKFAFQDTNNLYLVMEYLPGGDLAGLLENFQGYVSEDMAKFYMAETLMAIHCIHQMGYVHRDIKPDNILLDRCGHIKIADFGSAAKLNAEGKVDSPLPVGTPEYIAPEVLQAAAGEGGKYGVECDFWSFGVIAYEMIYGVTPFSSIDRTHIYSNILAHEMGSENLTFPGGYGESKEARQLIAGLLSPSPSRLSFRQIKLHAFFVRTSWETLKESVPPYIPSIEYETDVSNFNLPADDPPSPLTEEFLTKKIFSGRQLPFVGYSLNPSHPMSQPLAPTAAEFDSPRKIASGNNKGEHPDVVRARELKTLKDLLKDKEKRLEESMVGRREAETKLEQVTRKANEYHKTILKERNERQEVESKALDLVKGMKAKWSETSQQQVTDLNSQLKDAQIKLSSSEIKLKDFESKLKNQETQLNTERKANERLQTLLTQQKSSINKARRETLSFMEGADQLADLKNETARLKAINTDLQNQTDTLEEKLKSLDGEKKLLEKHITKIEKEKINLETMLEGTKFTLSEAEQKFEAESKKYKSKINKLESDLNNSIMELENSREMSNKEIELAEKVSELKSDLKFALEEKKTIEKKLRQAKDKDEEQQQKLEALEQCLTKMEDRIEKLEEENENLQTNELNISRRVSISATVSLEPAIIENGESQKEIEILQAQLERVETQLEKAREAAVLDRQACRTAQTELYKKEREISDLKLDLRISQRELKTSESLAQTLKEEKEQVTKKSEEIEAELKRVSEEQGKLKKDVDCAGALLSKSKADVENLEKKENNLHSSLIEKVQELSSLKHQLGEKTSLAAKLQKTLDDLKSESDSNKSTAQSAHSQLAQIRTQLESLRENNNALREVCTEQEQQLDDSEALRNAYEVQIEQGKQEVARLSLELKAIQTDFKSKTQEAEELRASKKVIQEILDELKEEAALRESDAVEDIKELKAQVQDARRQNETLLLQINEFEETLCDSDGQTRNLRQMICDLKDKNVDLQEEISATLTDLQAAKESAEKLSVLLETSHQNVKEKNSKIVDLEQHIKELKARHEEKVVKMEAQLAQQNKLIIFLQSKNESCKKKRTLADKIFGIHPKENIAPSPMLNKGMNTPMSAKEKARTWDCRPTPTKTNTVKKELIMGPPTPAAQKTAARPAISAPEIVKEVVEKRAIIPSGNGPVILEQRTLPEYCRLNINCAVPLAENVVLLGTEEGLYSLHPRSTGFQLVHIAGATRVKHISTSPHLGIAIFIVGSPPELRQCELRALTVAAEAAQCSKPSVTLKPVDHVPDQCHLCAVSPPLTIKDQKDVTFLCVANQSHISFLRWNYGSSQFEPIRLLATAFPTASVLFTSQSLLLVCDEIFEVDLKDFSVDEFLDMSDISLNSVRATLKARTKGPVKIIDVTKSSSKSEPEFMLCLPEVGVFIDAFGVRSRPGDFKWSHKPLDFSYKAPSLYVQYQSAIVELKPNADKLCYKDDSDASSTNSSDEGLLQLVSPKILGTGLKPGVIIASSMQSSGAVTLMNIVCQGGDDVSLMSEDDLPLDEFSFTSSLEQSLDEDGSSTSDSQRKVQFVK